MDLIVDNQLSHRYFVTKTSEHTFLLESVLSHQKWNIEILEERSTEYKTSVKGRIN